MRACLFVCPSVSVSASGFVCLFLGLLLIVLSSASDARLCVRVFQGQVFRFESKDHERLYFNMSITDFKRTSNKDLLASAAAELSPPSSPPTPHFMATNSDTSVAGSSSSSYSSSSFSLSSSSEASAPESPTISDSSRRVRISAPVVIPEKKPSSTTLVSPPTSPTRTTSKPALLTPSSPAHAPPLGASATASTGSSARQLGGETAAAGPRKQPSALLLNVTPPRQPSSREVESPARTPSALRILGQRTTSALRVQDTQRTTSTTKISLLMPRTVSKGQVGGPARTTSKASLAQEAPATPPTQPLRKPGQLAKRPGALPRKNKTFVDPDALVCVKRPCVCVFVLSDCVFADFGSDLHPAESLLDACRESRVHRA